MTENPEYEADRLRAELAGVHVGDHDPKLVDEAIRRGQGAGRRLWVLLALVVVALAVPGLIFLQSRLPDPGILGTPSATSPSTSVPSTASPSGTPSATPSTTPSGTPAPTPSAPESSAAPSESASTPAASSANPADVASYRADGPVGVGAYFASPSGNFLCALTDDGTVGCQSLVVVAGMDQCGTDPRVSAAMVMWRAGDDMATRGCTTQGLFVIPGTSDDTGNRVLPYGSSLTVADNVCESRETGVSCYPVGTNGGFTIAREGIRLPGE